MFYLLLNALLQGNIVYYHIGNGGIDVAEYEIRKDDIEKWDNIYHVL